ncbi:hypothetical protein FOA52_004144 [Chlamydomonas sp. UWO 241]|nr:hypothetical protein FOA52_004144 [Chlamydomonas sp. UWO 241]
MKAIKNGVVDQSIDLVDVSIESLNRLALKRMRDAFAARYNLKEVATRDSTIPIDEFEKQLQARVSSAHFMTSRVTQQQPSPQAQAQAQAPQDPRKDLYTLPLKPLPEAAHAQRHHAAPNANEATETQRVLQARPAEGHEAVRYVMINGFDRDWRVHKLRHEFPIDFTTVGNYKHVTMIKFTNLILPCENITSAKPQLISTFDMKMSFPYVLLRVEELEKQYVGMNNASRNTSVCFIYENSYKCTNGRSYIILKPAQHETLYTNMALSRLNFSIRRPTGALISNVTDSHEVQKVEYELYNQLYLKVVMTKYYDKTEFNVGDNVKASGYKIYKPDPSSDTTAAPDYNKINDFINRDEGHDIMQLGEPNEFGFYRNFYVTGPNTFDSVNGKLVVDKNMVDALKNYNLLVVSSASTGIGAAINTSIQPVIHMTFQQNLNVTDRTDRTDAFVKLIKCLLKFILCNIQTHPVDGGDFERARRDLNRVLTSFKVAELAATGKGVRKLFRMVIEAADDRRLVDNIRANDVERILSGFELVFPTVDGRNIWSLLDEASRGRVLDDMREVLKMVAL